MSHNYNNYSIGSSRPPPKSQETSAFESLTGSLIYPDPRTPIQQSYPQPWSGEQSWPNYVQKSNNYEMHYQGPPTGNGGKFFNHQEHTPYDEGDDFYDNGDANTVRGIEQGNQVSNESDGSTFFRGCSTTMLHDAPSMKIRTDEQPRTDSVRAGVATSKPDTAALNDRAAELRAKLLATKRGSTPGTPSNHLKKTTGYGSKGYSGSDDFTEPINKSLTEHLTSDRQNALGVSAGKSLPVTTKTDEAHGSSLTQRDGSHDIEALFAEARAANAARAAGVISIKDSADKDHIDRKLEISNKQTAATKPYLHSEVATSKSRLSMNSNMVSSDGSELGEILDDQSNPARAPHPEPLKSTNSGYKSRVSNEKPIVQTSADNNLKGQAAEKLNTISSGSLKSRAGGSSTQPRGVSATHQSPGSPSISQHRNSHQTPQIEQRQERNERPKSTQDLRHEQVHDPTSQPVQRAKDSLAPGQQPSRAQVHESERVSTARHKHYEPDFQASREHIERNARAAAVYKRELEDKARRQEARLANIELNPSTDTRGVRKRPALMPKATISAEKPLAADYNHHNQTPDNRPPEKETQRELKAESDKRAVETTTDLEDWLELTNYNDVPLRNQRLALFREMKATDAHRAELQRQAEQLGIIRTPSALSQESSEAAASRSIASPKSLRISSAVAMPPPPAPLQEGHDDLGIKIKNSANREILSSPRKSKRAHADNDLASRHAQPKIPRLDSCGVSGQSEPQLSPAIPRRGSTSLSARISADDRQFPTELRERSRSPQARRRSLTPVPRHREHPTSPIRFEIADTRSEQEFHGNIRSLRGYEAQSQDERGNFSTEYNPRWNSYRPNANYHESALNSNNRGHGRGGRSGYHSNTRGNHKPYRYSEGNHGVEEYGSASLDLQAGDSRYFMIKSWTSDNVETAQRDCIWATQPKNTAVLTEAYITCRNVILFFSINLSKAFQGYARMTSAPSEDNPPPAWSKPLIWKASPPFHIRWIIINDTPFNRTGHLKNALNEEQAVLVGKDGQEIEPNCGRALCELIDEEAKVDSQEGREPGAWSYAGRGEHGGHEGYGGGHTYDGYRGRGGRGRGAYGERREFSGYEEYGRGHGGYEGRGGRGSRGGGSEYHGYGKPGNNGWVGKVEGEDKMDWSKHITSERYLICLSELADSANSYLASSLDTKKYDGQTWKEIGHSLTDLPPGAALRRQQSDSAVRRQVKENEGSAPSSKPQNAPMLLIDGVRCEKLSIETTLANRPLYPGPLEMANYRMVLDQRWEAEAGSLRSRASSVISTGTKFSFSTSAHEEHPNIDGVLGRLNSVASRGRPGSILSCEEPAPPYDDGDGMDILQPPSAENETVSGTRSSTPVVEENVLPTTTPPSDSENVLSDHYTRIIRSLDESHAQELSALRNSINDAQERIELLQKEHEQQLAATRNEIDHTYRKEYKAVRREVEKSREAAATEAAALREEHEKAIVKARNAIEDIWEARWSDRIRVAAEEVERIETSSQQRLGRAAERIKELAMRYPDLAQELEGMVEGL